MSIRHLVAFCLFALAGIDWFLVAHRPLPPAGIVVEETPQQGEVGPGETSWPVADAYRATALASYRVHARVLGVERYRYDPCAAIAPFDLALGWGSLSDSSVYGRLDVAQRGRFYVYGWGSEGPPVPPGEIVTHSANTHIIPADDEVARVLRSVRVHDVVRMEGALVEVTGPGGFHWRSSLTRDDTGNGACELFRVTTLVIEPP